MCGSVWSLAPTTVRTLQAKKLGACQMGGSNEFLHGSSDVTSDVSTVRFITVYYLFVRVYFGLLFIGFISAI